MYKNYLIIVFSALISAIPTLSCAMAQVVCPEVIFVQLKNGTIAPAQLAFDTHLAVTKIIASHNCFAVRELLENCVNNSQDPVSDQSGHILRAYGLVTPDNKPSAHLVNILKSMARGKGDKLAVINPVMLTE